MSGWTHDRSGPCCGPEAACGHSRRNVLTMLSGTGVALAAGIGTGRAQAADDWIVDVHHHVYPPRYVRDNLKRIVDDSSAPASLYTSWTVGQALERMDKARIRTSIVSMTSPGIWWNNGEEARVWARECNEFGAQLMRDHAVRFGMFAAIPLPDTQGSLAEIAYALDVLKHDGIGLLTSYAGKPLGDPSFAPVMEELNRRKAAVFVHPTMSCCGMVIPPLSGPEIDFTTDTTRALASLAFSGTFTRFPDIRFIFSHGGGTLPIIIQRFVVRANDLSRDDRARSMPDGFEALIRRQHYDVANVAVNVGGMQAVFDHIPMSQLMYGSDEPFGRTTVIADALTRLNLAPSDLRAIRRDNALAMFPRLAL